MLGVTGNCGGIVSGRRAVSVVMSGRKSLPVESFVGGNSDDDSNISGNGPYN